ncbi:hypothetical protein QBC34DRAFT_379855 [Podospora aff. communis PSN243]|uniref:Uncharacterized protein n=1 Tax=Podospora aff. communis PSN243 TaxID=3040156 RepID=A0AAV9GNI8_9PEZI|nr:hypothetical protein QBC34DRAFT_379855 [Podospora aff. communis PSN243]
MRFEGIFSFGVVLAAVTQANVIGRDTLSSHKDDAESDMSVLARALDFIELEPRKCDMKATRSLTVPSLEQCSAKIHEV